MVRDCRRGRLDCLVVAQIDGLGFSDCESATRLSGSVRPARVEHDRGWPSRSIIPAHPMQAITLPPARTNKIRSSSAGRKRPYLPASDDCRKRRPTVHRHHGLCLMRDMRARLKLALQVYFKWSFSAIFRQNPALLMLRSRIKANFGRSPVFSAMVTSSRGGPG